MGYSHPMKTGNPQNTTADTREPAGGSGSRLRLVDSYWGETEDDGTRIHTRVNLVAPNLLSGELSGVDIGYQASMNEVTVAEAERSNVALHPDSTELNLDAVFHHDSVPDWWRSHVENDEETEITVAPTVDLDIERALDINLPLTDVSLRTPALHRGFSTDVLDSVPESCPQETTVLGRTVFRVEDVEVEWGEVTETETPVEVEATVTNPTRFPMPFGDVRYEIRMNDVVVGEGDVETGGFPADTTKDVEAQAAIQVDRLTEWWPTHVREDEDTAVEETVLEVEFYAAVGALGVSRRVTLFEHSDTVETSVFAR